jgi:hypothetical protein
MGDKGAGPMDDTDKNIEMWKIKRVRLVVLSRSARHASRCPLQCTPLTTRPRCAAAALQLTKALQEARGNGTSMISLIMPPKDQARMCIDWGSPSSD